MPFLFKNVLLPLINNNLNTYNDSFIHLEDNNNINYWLKKLGISKEILIDAILYTGSINTGDIKSYLKKNKKHLPLFTKLYQSF